jgi:hypothetical protein
MKVVIEGAKNGWEGNTYDEDPLVPPQETSSNAVVRLNRDRRGGIVQNIWKGL